ncbi:MAG TPA: hypothetical protein VFM25_01630 [Verrucomicrobiae bacterium]|nr:hypothetical protein [Verrucomicrobiae bacterium]
MAVARGKFYFFCACFLAAQISLIRAASFAFAAGLIGPLFFVPLAFAVLGAALDFCFPLIPAHRARAAAASFAFVAALIFRRRRGPPFWAGADALEPKIRESSFSRSAIFSFRFAACLSCCELKLDIVFMPSVRANGG